MTSAERATPEPRETGGVEPEPDALGSTRPAVEVGTPSGAAPDGGDAGGVGDAGPAVLLPPAVRARVLALSAGALNAADISAVPPSLKAVRRFTPSRQTRLGGTALAAALEADSSFRDLVAGHVRRSDPLLAEALDEGTLPAASSPVELAAVAYLLRAPGWVDVVERAVEESARLAAVDGADELSRLREEMAAAAARSQAETARLRAELAEAKADNDDLRRRARAAELALQRSAAEHDALRAETTAATSAAEQAAAVTAREMEAETRRLRGKLAEAEAALGSARRSTRDARGADAVRLRVLLDTVLSAAAGLRRELDLPLVVERPADVAAAVGERPFADPLAAVFAARGQRRDDPALVDAVLATPGVHLLVDGYNVTKTGYPDMTLEVQRNRLLSGLAALAARTAAELTVVFDGTSAANRPTAVPVPRGVRVLFSAVGELADEVLVRLVRAEPPGRPVAVVTNDREVIEGARSADARALPSEALLARLNRA